MKSRFIPRGPAAHVTSPPPASVENLTSGDFIESVLAARPGLAVFDCDGTLWDGDAGEQFFDWELKRGLFSEEMMRAMRSRYADYRAGKVCEDDMCGEMVTLHKKLNDSEVRSLATEFFESYFVRRIFPEMLELIMRLQQTGCEVWAVSSTNNWVIGAAMKHFNIAEERILAACVEIHDGTITDRLIRVPSGPGKPRAILDVVKRVPDAAFGNSRWDAEMLAMAGKAYAVNPNPDLEEIARRQGWTIYFPRAASLAE